MITGIIGLAVLFFFLFLGIPIGFAMTAVGFGGMVYLKGITGALSILASTPYLTSANYVMSVLPLFVFMGLLAANCGFSTDLYTMGYKLVSRVSGAVAIATIFACAGFAAICGSSAASGATMAAMAFPEMQKYNYSKRLSGGTIAAGSTLGILIPPSVPLVIYGALTETSIGQLLIAGIFPGILLATLFILVIYVWTKLKPGSGPVGAQTTTKEKLSAMVLGMPTLLIFLMVMGGIYLGTFTPTEAGGVGAFLVFILAVCLRRIAWRHIRLALKDTIKTTVMIFTLFIGAMIFVPFLVLTRLPTLLSTFVIGLNASPYVILLAVTILYLILGCIMETISMIIITVPIIFPMLTALGFDPIWLGVFCVILWELALITPPIGMNCFIVKGTIGESIKLSEIFMGVLPFALAMLICILFLAVFPQIALFLPNLM